MYNELIDNQEITVENEYLGQWIPKSGFHLADIKRRIKLARRANGRNSIIYQSI